MSIQAQIAGQHPQTHDKKPVMSVLKAAIACTVTGGVSN